MSDTTYGLVIVDSGGDDLGDIIDLTDELRKSPSLLKEKIDEVIKKHEDAIEEDKEDEEPDYDEEDDE